MGLTKSEFHWRVCTYVCPWHKFCFVRQNSTENCNFAVWFLLLSLTITPEQRNLDAQLGRRVLQRVTWHPASPASLLSPGNNFPSQGEDSAQLILCHRYHKRTYHKKDIQASSIPVRKKKKIISIFLPCEAIVYSSSYIVARTLFFLQ